MEITFLTPTLNFSGGIKSIIQIANGLSEKGHDVAIYAPRFPEFSGHVNFGWKLKYIDPKIPARLYISNIQIPHSDIIIATGWETAYQLDRLYEERKDFIPVYFIQHIETWDYYNTGEMSENDHLALNTYTFPYHKIVTSDWLKQYICTPYKVPMGIDPVPDVYKEYYGAKHGCPYVSYIERGIPWKGDDLIKEVAKEFPINIFKNISNEYLDSVLWRSDIFLSASLVEGFNLPVLEAMAHGCCCVSTNTGALPEYSDRLSAVFPVTRDVNSFRMALEYLQENPEICVEMGKQARELSREWTIQRTVNEFEKVLNDLKR